MSDFELVDQGEGRFAIRGDMSFATADRILKASLAKFGQHESLEIDMSQVGKADSAGLALLIEWKARAAARDADIRYAEIPGSLIAIAKTSEVSELL